MKTFAIRMILLSALLCIASLSCNILNPKEPVNKANVRLNFELKEDQNSGSLILQSKSSDMTLPAQSIKLSSLSSTEGIQTIDDVVIVFYDIDLTLEELLLTYSENYIEIEEFLTQFEGDQTDFEQFWMNRDAEELHIGTDGHFTIELRSNLTLTDSTAHGEFELSEGVKVCRVGFFEGGTLTYVGQSEGESGTSFFEVMADEIRDVYVFYTFVESF